MKSNNKTVTHTFSTVDCGGACGGCVALIVDGLVIDGPAFHQNCGCSLSDADIKNAPVYQSQLSGPVCANGNTKLQDAKWLKSVLLALGFYEPDVRAHETINNINTYPNQSMFDAIEKLQRAYKLPQCKIIKPGHWEEAILQQALAQYKDIDIPQIKEGLLTLKYYKPDTKNGESAMDLFPYPSLRLDKSIARFQQDNNINTMDNIMNEIKEKLSQLDQNSTKINTRVMSEQGIEFLKHLEGKRVFNNKHVIYDDSTGKRVMPGSPLPRGATIGYGHLIQPNEDFSNGLTEEEAIALFRQDMKTAEKIVRETIKVPISQNQFDALTMLAFNIGMGNFKNSTIVKYINNPDFHSSIYPTKESAWKSWNKTQGKTSKGLINRRNDEWNLFNNGKYN